MLFTAPLVYAGCLVALFAFDGFGDTSRNQVIVVCGRALLSLVYAVRLWARLTGRGGGRVATTVRVGVLVLGLVLVLGVVVFA